MKVTAAKVWVAIEDIGGLDRWFPIIDACRVEGEGEGALQMMTLAGGAGEMCDRIIEVAPRERRLRYHRTHLPFPISDYFGVVEI
ncbi:MAG: SRPBCC family protein [Methylocystis sp.]